MATSLAVSLSRSVDKRPGEYLVTDDDVVGDDDDDDDVDTELMTGVEKKA